MQSSNASPDDQSPDLPGPKKQVSRRVISGRAIASRLKAAMAAQPGPASSPPMPTQSGLTPNQPRPRRSSVNLPVPDGDTPRDTALVLPGPPPEESDYEMDTPTKKPARGTRVKPPGPNNRLGPSPLRKTPPPGPDVAAASHEAAEASPPLLFARSHTSPETQGDAERRSQRPSAAERSASEPATPSKKLSGAQLDSSMAKVIRDGPAKDKKEAHLKNGGIYLFIIQPRGSELQLVKIGRTERDAQGRLKEIQAQCGHLRSFWHRTAMAEDIPFHGFAEKLIHAELENYRYRRKCARGKTHREYFKVREDVAVDVFTRWRDFCKKRPWDDGGTIKAVWGKRLDTRAAFEGPDQGFDHGKFGTHWSTYTAPWLIELVLSDAIHQWKSWFPDRWQAVVVAEMLTIFFLSPSSTWARVWITAVGALFMIDKAIPADLHVTASVARFMEGGLQSLVLQYVYWRDGLAADAEGSAPGAGPGETPRREAGEDERAEAAEEDAAAASDGAASSSVGVGDPMDVDGDAGCREPTDEEDGPDGDDDDDDNDDNDDVCFLHTSLETASARDGVSERPGSLDLKAQKLSGGREVMMEVTDLPMTESD
ncbi:meiotically up-regulated gene 113-domain-containing protein [Colletotrichum cereale]|nr:meiotically up-regulated gene 113-domain-containing protein [Colletotrichum cereale]